MPILGVDLSENQDDNLPWPAWVAAGVKVAIARASIGYRIDNAYPANLMQARAAGVEMRAAYHAILHHDRNIPYFDPQRQAKTFVDLLIAGLSTVCVLDVEAAGVTEPMVRAFCDYFDAHSRLPLWLYGNMDTAALLWANRARYERYGFWWADYGYVDLATDRRSTPPPNVAGRPALPRTTLVGRKVGWQFAGDNGRLAPYSGAIDLSYYDGTESDLRAVFGLAAPSVGLAGLHGRANGRLEPADLDSVRISRVEAVKLMGSAAPEDVGSLLAIRPDMFLMVRLFESFAGGRVLSAVDFATSAIQQVRLFQARGVKYFEIHNEPNLTNEGYGASWPSAAAFAAWFIEVYQRIKAAAPDALLGFPGISPGPDLFELSGKRIRAAALPFLAGADAAVRLADWLGIHVYWQSAAELELESGGYSYLEYGRRYPTKRLFITEFSNSNAAELDASRAAQYVRFYKRIRQVPNMGAAFAFVVSSSAGFRSEVWRLESGNQTVIPGLVGAGLAEVPPAGDKPRPVIERGPKIGIHAIVPNISIGLVRRARDAGWTWPVFKAVDNAGILPQVKAISPKTICIYRAVNTVEDPAQGVGTWSQAEMAAHARATLDFTMGRLVTPAELAATDYIEPINEADPPFVSGWRAFGLYLMEMVREANKRGVKLALPGANNGTPEWAEMRAFVETGLFGLMRASGHILTLHEGVFNNTPIDAGVGAGIPGAPTVAGAGTLALRYRYLYSLLRTRGEVVPLVISEFYAGGNFTPADAMARFAWYDDQIRRDDYVLACLGYTVDPGPNWTGQDYNPFYNSPELWAYIQKEKNMPNASIHIDEATRLDLLAGARAAAAADQALVDKLVALAPPANWWDAWPVGVYNPSVRLPTPTVPIQLYDSNDNALPLPKRQNTLDAYERRGHLFRVINAPINGVLWWIRAEDIPVPAV